MGEALVRKLPAALGLLAFMTFGGCSHGGADDGSRRLEPFLSGRDIEAVVHQPVTEFDDVAGLPLRSGLVLAQEFVIDEPGAHPSSVALLVYRLANSKAWSDGRIELAYRGLASNFVDQDQDQVRMRLPQWRIDVSTTTRKLAEKGEALCTVGWNATGYSDCLLVEYWFEKCGYGVDIGLVGLSGEASDDRLKLNQRLVASVLEAVPC